MEQKDKDLEILDIKQIVDSVGLSVKKLIGNIDNIKNPNMYMFGLIAIEFCLSIWLS